MKNISLLFPFLLVFQFLAAQEIPPAFGDEYQNSTEDQCLSPEERLAIQRMLESNRVELMDAGIIEEVSQNPEFITLFDWPVRKAANLSWNNCFAISNYVDHDPTATGAQYGASNLDYNCGNRTYDTNTGYNHQGIDIFTWPFSWYLYENDLAEVIAGADGIIIGKDDGNEDDHCACSGQWNAVYVQHADGSVAWYGHLKTNSLTAKAVGETVSKGEYLGVVASSGCSTGPHLHFEVYDNNNNLIDPYAGDCNGMNGSSWWANQPAYRTSTLNALLTHDAPPQLGCPGTNEQPNLSNTFMPGETVYTAFYYQDQLTGDLSSFRLRQPNNAIWLSWNHTSPDTYIASYWYWTRNLPNNGPFGTWKLEADYKGETFIHEFEYVDPNSCPTDAVVNTNPTHQQIIEASNSVSTAGVVEVNNGITATFKAGNTITLNQDFHAKSGANFHAYIDDCSNAFLEEEMARNLIESPIIQTTTPKEWAVEVFPNPTNGQFTITNAASASVKIINNYGKICAEFPEMDHSTLDIRHLPKGVYFVLVKGTEGVVSKKVVKL